MIADVIKGEKSLAPRVDKIDIASAREARKIDINHPGERERAGGALKDLEGRTQPLRSSKANNCLPKIDYPRVR